MLFEPATAAKFPVRLSADYPQRLSRLSTTFRLILALPLLIPFYALAQGASYGLTFGYWIGVLVRGRPVRWLFDATVAVQRFQLRVSAYLLLLTDRYPPFDGDWPLRYEADLPDRLSRWRLVIWKTITAIPHFIVLAFLLLGVVVVIVITWFAVLFTGSFPRGLHSFVAGTLRWSARVNAYWISLTDEFPSFSLAEDEGPAYHSSYVISAIFGCLITAAIVGGVVALIAVPGETKEVSVSYDALLRGEQSPAVEIAGVAVGLVGAQDPYDFIDDLYVPEDPRDRFVLFTLVIANGRDQRLPLEENDFRLTDAEGAGSDPFLLTVDGVKPPLSLRPASFAQIAVLLEVDDGVLPAELRYKPNAGFKKTVKFLLE